MKPFKVIKRDDQVFNVRPKKRRKDKNAAEMDEIGVQRGFLHVIYKFDDYTLHLVSAHLKAKVHHYRYSQADMRRLEARQLRYLINDILKNEPEANILVVGDMNDTFDSKPISIIRDFEQPPERRLLDLRPLDVDGFSWSHWWDEQDSYARIDYTLCSKGLLPEIVFEQTRIVSKTPTWMVASDHRPLLVTIETKQKPVWSEESLEKLFPKGIRNFPY